MSERAKFLDYVNVYDFDCVLPGSKETVKFKPVTTGQIKKLLTFENETNYVVQEQALDELISSSVFSEGFDINSLYIYDRLFLLIEIRKKTKGEVLEFKVNCPKCNSQSVNRSDLDKLELKEINHDIDTVVELSSGIKVHLRHMTRGQQKQDMRPEFFPQGVSETQQAYIFQVLFHSCAIDKIELPDGIIEQDINMEDKMFFIENIPMGEMEKIRDKIEEMAFGWMLEQTIRCVHCGFENKEAIPIQQNFFG